MGVTCRRFKCEEDYFGLREFMGKSVSESGTKFYFNLNDLDFYFDLYEDKNQMQAITEQLDNLFLWFEDEKIIGGILLFNRIQMFINPSKKHLFNEMFRTAEEAVNEYIKEGNGAAYVSDFGQCSWRPFDGDAELENVLMKNGYCMTDEYWVLRCFNHGEPVEEPKLPEGYHVKTLSELPDITKVVQMYDECLGMEVDEFTLRNLNQFDTYRNELDMVVVDSKDSPVALCSGRYDEKNKMASFEAVACFKEHRKKGVSKAMMLHALKVAGDLGAEVSTVFTLSPEQFPAPNRLYETAGFKLVGNRHAWRKI